MELKTEPLPYGAEHGLESVGAINVHDDIDDDDIDDDGDDDDDSQLLRCHPHYRHHQRHRRCRRHQYHNDYIKDIPEGFIITARDSNNIIQSIENKET